MIKLFEFQQKEIRTTIIGSDVWFSAQDVFNVLCLTWKGSRDLKERNIPAKWICKRGGESLGGIQDMIFISEQALYKIVFRANKSEIADSFTDWVADLLVKLRKSIENGNSNELRQHLNTDVQKGYSKQVNAKNFNEGGVTQTIEYNAKNCVLHTGKSTKEIKEFGKSLGLKSTQTSSAKQVLRELKPEIACSMSLTDKLVTENLVEHEKAASICKQYATPLFEQFLQLGISQKELE